MAYCEASDLILTGDVIIPAYLDQQKFVDDAADEIDSKIGFVYSTPVDVANVQRPVMLLLKRINVSIATGRLLLSAATGGEDSQVNAYGLYLLRQGEEALDAIASGKMQLPGVPSADAEDSQFAGNVPLISNVDAVSAVDVFYGGMVAPGGMIDPRRPLGPPLYYPLAGG